MCEIFKVISPAKSVVLVAYFLGLTSLLPVTVDAAELQLIPAIESQTDVLSIVILWEAEPSVDYLVQRNTDTILQSDAWENLVSLSRETPGLLGVTNNIAGIPAAFYRVTKARTSPLVLLPINGIPTTEPGSGTELANPRIEPPSLQITNPASRQLDLTRGAIVEFSAESNSSAEPEPPAISWFFQSRPEEIFTGSNFSHTFEEAGLFRVIATAAFPSLEVIATDFVSIRVTEGKPPSLQITNPASGPLDLNRGDTFEFSAESNSSAGPEPPAIRWFFQSRPEEIFTGLNFSYTFAEAGLFTVIARATYPSGVFSTDFVQIRVTDPETGIPAVIEIIAPADNQSVSIGVPITFAGRLVAETGPTAGTEPISDAGEVSFTWTTGNGESLVGLTPTFTYSEPGRYRVRLLAISGSRRLEDSVTIFVVDREQD